MLLELRIENLLLIERAELRFGRGAERDHRRDRRGEDGPRALARSADGRQGEAADRPAGRRGGLGRGRRSTCPQGLLSEPELAELAERLPEGAEEIVLGRRVSASGRTSAFVAGRSASAADLRLLGGRLLAFYGQHEHRKLTISSAQLEILDGFAGAEQLERRAQLPRRAPRAASAWGRSWPSSASATAPASATSTCCATSSPRSRRRRPTPPRRRSWRRSASACATPRGCGCAAGGRIGGDRRGRGGRTGRRRCLAACARRHRMRSAGVDRALDDRRSGSSRWRSSSGTWRASCAPTSRGSRRIPRRLGAVEERLERARPAGAQARRQHRLRARARRALPGGDRAARGRRASGRRSSRRELAAAEDAPGRGGARAEPGPSGGGQGAASRGSRRSSSSWRCPGRGWRSVLEAAPRGLRGRGGGDGRAAGLDQSRDRAGPAARRRLRRASSPG